MPRTIIDIPTALPEQEVTARLERFLFSNGFKKTRWAGDELYGTNQGWLELDDSYYVKARQGGGTLRLEVFRVHKGWERPADGPGSNKGRELLARLQPVLAEIGSHRPNSGLWQPSPQQAPVGRPAANFCPNCGARLTGSARFCPECGAKVP